MESLFRTLISMLLSTALEFVSHLRDKVNTPSQ